MFRERMRAMTEEQRQGRYQNVGDPIKRARLMSTYAEGVESPYVFQGIGAFEIAFENGPVLLDRDYWIEGTVLGVGESPKTEYLWWDAATSDAEGRVVARMRHLLRFLKASSPLYPELAG